MKWTRNLLCVCASWWIARNSAPTEENRERTSYSAGKRLSVGTINYRGAYTHCFLLAKPPSPETVCINRRAVIIERRAVRLTYRGDPTVRQCPKIFACKSLFVRVRVHYTVEASIIHPLQFGHPTSVRIDSTAFVFSWQLAGKMRPNWIDGGSISVIWAGNVTLWLMNEFRALPCLSLSLSLVMCLILLVIIVKQSLLKRQWRKQKRETLLLLTQQDDAICILY